MLSSADNEHPKEHLALRLNLRAVVHLFHIVLRTAADTRGGTSARNVLRPAKARVAATLGSFGGRQRFSLDLVLSSASGMVRLMMCFLTAFWKPAPGFSR